MDSSHKFQFVQLAIGMAIGTVFRCRFRRHRGVDCRPREDPSHPGIQGAPGPQGDSLQRR